MSKITQCGAKVRKYFEIATILIKKDWHLEERPVFLYMMRVGLSTYGGFELLGVLGELEGFDEVLDVAVHEGGEVVHRVADAVVGDAALGVVVGAYFLGAVACGHESLTFGGHLFHVFVVLAFVKSGTEDDEGFLEVLNLRLLVLTGDHDASGDMGEADGGIGGVDALAARTGGAEGVFAHIGHVEFYVEFFGFGQYNYSCCGGLETALGLGSGDALDAVHAALVFQQSVGFLTGDAEGDSFVATSCALVEVINLYLPALFLAEAGVHAE